MVKGEGGLSGSPLFNSGPVAGDGLHRIQTSAVTVHALKVGVTQSSKRRYSSGGVEGKELLRGEIWKTKTKKGR